MKRHVDVVVIGGGQAGLAAGYHLRRRGPEFVVLDAQATPGGAWQHMWDSLRLFSPAAYSSLPGRVMPGQPGETYPDARHVVDYLTDYEKRYELPVVRPVRVEAVHRDGAHLRVETDAGSWCARAVISATGAWWRPFIPAVPGRTEFSGVQLHTVGYRRPADLAGQKVVVVGGGNSGAQIAADLVHASDVSCRYHSAQSPRRGQADGSGGRAPAGGGQQLFGGRVDELTPGGEEANVRPAPYGVGGGGPGFQDERQQAALGEMGGGGEPGRARSDHDDRQVRGGCGHSGDVLRERRQIRPLFRLLSMSRACHRYR
ncbi:Ferredoxin--NADP reductase [Streptomyces microflavus]